VKVRVGRGRAGLIASLSAATALLAGVAAHAHVVSDREVLMLRDLPAGFVAGLWAPPDSAGHAGANARGWQHVEHQAEALPRLMDACARSDSTAAEAAWKAIDAAFVRQLPAGDFQATRQEPRARQLERTAWWIAQLCRAEIVLMNSPLQKRFSWRVTLMRLKLRRSVDWLVQAGDEIVSLHAKRPELLLVDAQAWLLADGIFHEPRFAELGQKALVTALGQQGKDGSFVGKAGAIGAQARAVSALIAIATYFPMPTLDDAARRGARHLAARLPRSPGRNASARNGAAGVEDALLALAYHASRERDARLRQRVERFAGVDGR
jgi:hypothetical protein